MVDVTDETWNDSSHELTGASRVVGGDPYELRIAGWNDGGKWKLASVSVSAEDAAAGVTIAARPQAAERGRLDSRGHLVRAKPNRSVDGQVREAVIDTGNPCSRGWLAATGR